MAAGEQAGGQLVKVAAVGQVMKGGVAGVVFEREQGRRVD